MTKILNEGLDYHDMEGQILPYVSVDEYKSKIGKDSDIVTLAFTVKSKLAGRDLVEWFERGYNFVLDAKLSDGEVSSGKWLVFVEMNRRLNVPTKIVELLDDLKSLSDIKLNDWTITVDDEEYEADENVLKQVIILNPNEYRAKKTQDDSELNEMREIAGLKTKSHFKPDEYIKNLKAIAGM